MHEELQYKITLKSEQLLGSRSDWLDAEAGGKRILTCPCGPIFNAGNP